MKMELAAVTVHDLNLTETIFLADSSVMCIYIMSYMLVCAGFKSNQPYSPGDGYPKCTFFFYISTFPYLNKAIA